MPYSITWYAASTPLREETHCFLYFIYFYFTDYILCTSYIKPDVPGRAEGWPLSQNKVVNTGHTEHAYFPQHLFFTYYTVCTPSKCKCKVQTPKYLPGMYEIRNLLRTRIRPIQQYGSLLLYHPLNAVVAPVVRVY